MTDAGWPTRHNGQPETVARIQHGYSRASNRTYRENAVSKSQASRVYLDELYTYDGLYQLRDLDRGQLNAGKTAISGGTLNYAQESGFDATGNWRGYREDTDGNGAWNLDQSRSHNEANEINGITGGSWVTPVHDRAGNMTTIPQGGDPTQSYTVTWDAWNRAVKYQSGITTVLENAFDALGRRVKKIASGTTRHLYYSSRWQVVEERLNAASAADRQFIWGIRYIDELVLRDRDSDGSAATGNLGISGSGLDERLYALQDANWNVTALADTSASIVERVTYDAYGKPAFRDASFGIRGSSLYGWETAFAGYRYDAEVQGYYVRYRPMHYPLGRFLSVDPLVRRRAPPPPGFSYVRNSPIDYIDPFGLEDEIPWLLLPGVPGLRGPTVIYSDSVPDANLIPYSDGYFLILQPRAFEIDPCTRGWRYRFSFLPIPLGAPSPRRGLGPGMPIDDVNRLLLHAQNEHDYDCLLKILAIVQSHRRLWVPDSCTEWAWTCGERIKTELPKDCWDTVSFRVTDVDWYWGYFHPAMDSPGWAGHCGLRIHFTDGSWAFFDNGAMAGPDRVGFPEDLPAHAGNPLGTEPIGREGRAEEAAPWWHIDLGSSGF